LLTLEIILFVLLPKIQQLQAPALQQPVEAGMGN